MRSVAKSLYNNHIGKWILPEQKRDSAKLMNKKENKSKVTETY